MNKFARSVFAVAASGALVFGSAGIAAAQGGETEDGTGLPESNQTVFDSMEAAQTRG